MSRTAQRTPALLSPKSGVRILRGREGRALCPLASAVLAYALCAVIPLFFYAAEIAAAKMLLFFRESATIDIFNIWVMQQD